MFDGRVILVNYRSADLVRARVRELRRGPEPPAEIVVVDNDPAGGLPDGLEGLDAEVRHIPMAGNAGFAAAMNRGMEGLSRPFALWLNPDARPDAGCIEGLQEALRAHPGAAAAAPALHPPESGRPMEPCATRRDPAGPTLFWEYGPWGAAGRRWLRRHYFLMAGPGPSEPTPCAAVQGACLMTHRDAWARIGPLDAERFFLYWEETDYCRRARALGWTILFCPRLRCAHEGGASVAGGRQDAEAFWRSARAYFIKHDGPRAAGAMLGMVSALTALHVVLLRLGDLRHRPPRAAREEFRNLLRARRLALRRARKKEPACAG